MWLHVGRSPPNEHCYEAVLSGEIVLGDADRMKAFLQQERQLAEIRLASPGGDLLEAMKIARLVRDALLETKTATYDVKKPSEGACDSACAIVAFGGVSRQLGNIGLHRPYSQSASQVSFEEAKRSHEVVIGELERFFTEMALPHALLDRMLTVGPEGVDRIYYPKEDVRRIVPDFYAPFQEWLHPRCKDAEKYYLCMYNERKKEILKRADLSRTRGP
jgi:hypothetical protein